LRLAVHIAGKRQPLGATLLATGQTAHVLDCAAVAILE
jgi:hypothetical protein